MSISNICTTAGVLPTIITVELRMGQDAWGEECILWDSLFQEFRMIERINTMEKGQYFIWGDGGKYYLSSTTSGQRMNSASMKAAKVNVASSKEKFTMITEKPGKSYGGFVGYTGWRRGVTVVE